MIAFQAILFSGGDLYEPAAHVSHHTLKFTVLSLNVLRSSKVAATIALAFLCAAPARAGEVMLQYYESKWETVENRLPDIFKAGYSSLWLPPPGKADTVGYSVSYDVFDRFNLGKPNDQTLYGTESGARQLVRKSHDAGLKVYFDYIMNHNGFRDASTPGFVA